MQVHSKQNDQEEAKWQQLKKSDIQSEEEAKTMKQEKHIKQTIKGYGLHLITTLIRPNLNCT